VSARADRFWGAAYMLARVALGGIFLAAALPKMWRPDQFADAVNNYRVLPYFLVNAAALGLPWVEFLFGTFLVVGFRVRAASLAATIMMTVFLAAIVSAAARGIDITCGCFGTGAGDAPISWHEIVRDASFLVLCLWVLFKPLPRPPRPIPRIG
jgi:uncharacterized membrane protein YphA (DoxX/SURF4 family)